MNNLLNDASGITEYQNALRPFAFNLTQNKEECDDLLQDTFCRALQHQEKFEEGTNIKGWLFTIMRNTFINDYHKKRRKGTVVDINQNQALLNNPNRASQNRSEDVFLGEALSKALEQLNPEFSRPFMMHFNGYQYLEIAETFNVPLGTIKSRIFSARKELQTRLKEMGIHHSN